MTGSVNSLFSSSKLLATDNPQIIANYRGWVGGVEETQKLTAGDPHHELLEDKIHLRHEKKVN